MAQDGYRKPLPTPSPESKRYWDGCRNHELWIPFCRNCQKFYFYPRDFCPACFGSIISSSTGYTSHSTTHCEP